MSTSVALLLEGWSPSSLKAFVPGPCERVGALVRVIERVLDEVAAREGEPCDGPRMTLWALSRWSNGDNSALVEVRSLWAQRLGDEPALSGDHAFGWVRGAVLNLAAVAITGSMHNLTVACAQHALVRLGENLDAARARIDGELALELSRLDPARRAAA